MPLVPGLKGVDADGHQVTLRPGVLGYMYLSEALSAQHAGDIQLIARHPKTGDKPRYETGDRRSRRKYRRSDVTAENE